MRAMFRTVSEYDQEIPQSQTADNPVAPRGRGLRITAAEVVVILWVHCYKIFIFFSFLIFFY